jgi:hypothetical protein
LPEQSGAGAEDFYFSFGNVIVWIECIMEYMKQIPTRALLLAGVSSENTDILENAWNRCPDDVAIANALQVVCETGQTGMVIDMLRRGARIGKESVWAACRSGKWDTIKELIEGGANITDVEMDMLRRYGHTMVIQRLVELQLPRSAPAVRLQAES